MYTEQKNEAAGAKLAPLMVEGHLHLAGQANQDVFVEEEESGMGDVEQDEHVEEHPNDDAHEFRVHHRPQLQQHRRSISSSSNGNRRDGPNRKDAPSPPSQTSNRAAPFYDAKNYVQSNYADRNTEGDRTGDNLRNISGTLEVEGVEAVGGIDMSFVSSADALQKEIQDYMQRPYHELAFLMRNVHFLWEMCRSLKSRPGESIQSENQLDVNQIVAVLDSMADAEPETIPSPRKMMHSRKASAKRSTRPASPDKIVTAEDPPDIATNDHDSNFPVHSAEIGAKAPSRRGDSRLGGDVSNRDDFQLSPSAVRSRPSSRPSSRRSVPRSFVPSLVPSSPKNPVDVMDMRMTTDGEDIVRSVVINGDDGVRRSTNGDGFEAVRKSSSRPRTAAGPLTPQPPSSPRPTSSRRTAKIANSVEQSPRSFSARSSSLPAADGSDVYPLNQYDADAKKSTSSRPASSLRRSALDVAVPSDGVKDGEGRYGSRSLWSSKGKSPVTKDDDEPGSVQIRTMSSSSRPVSRSFGNAANAGTSRDLISTSEQDHEHPDALNAASQDENVDDVIERLKRQLLTEEEVASVTPGAVEDTGADVPDNNSAKHDGDNITDIGTIPKEHDRENNLRPSDGLQVKKITPDGGDDEDELSLDHDNFIVYDTDLVPRPLSMTMGLSSTAGPGGNDSEDRQQEYDGRIKTAPRSSESLAAATTLSPQHPTRPPSSSTKPNDPNLPPTNAPNASNNPATTLPPDSGGTRPDTEDEHRNQNPHSHPHSHRHHHTLLAPAAEVLDHSHSAGSRNVHFPATNTTNTTNTSSALSSRPDTATGAR
ncbi:hypothetical protein HK102_012564, partial [Quaeritorhiza haematococci]